MDIIGDIIRHYVHIPIIMGSVLLYGFLLYYGFFKPVRKILDERQHRLDKSALMAQKAREEGDKQSAAYESKLSEARIAGMKVREDVRAEIAEYQGKLLDDVRKEIASKKAAREKEFEAIVAKAESDLKTNIPELARMIAEKILKRRIAA